jgi:methylamine--corrinoid protein Co-methyltransferase
LVEGYEKRFADAPPGKTFQECYDVDRIRPTDEYESLFARKKKEWSGLGLDFSIPLTK